jgi:ubiquinone/menaquinone biosynthesis C-methylase UbiE
MTTKVADHLIAQYPVPATNVGVLRGSESHPDANADVTWEGPEYAKLRPIVFGYAMFQALFAACELNLFTKLSHKPGMTADEVAEVIHLPAHSTRLLLLTCSSMELVVKNGDRYYNSYAAEKLLIPGKPKCAIPFIRSGQFLQYKGFYHLLAALKQETNAGLQEYREGHLYDRMSANPELELVLYEVMAAIWELSHPGLDNIAEFKQVKHLLDVGGGNAVVASLVHDKYPHLRISVLDRPSACELAKMTIAENGKKNYISTIPGDMFKSPFPSEPDAIIYSHILEELTPEDRQRLIEKAFAALPSGGRLFAFDFTCRDDERGELYGARISLYFLVNATGSGMAFPPKEYVGWFERVGFKNVKAYKELPFEHALIVGTKP